MMHGGKPACFAVSMQVFTILGSGIHRINMLDSVSEVLPSPKFHTVINNWMGIWEADVDQIYRVLLVAMHLHPGDSALEVDRCWRITHFPTALGTCNVSVHPWLVAMVEVSV